ncbi:hypothetical protein MKW94_025831 [Papaver nudicaule]|uniref:Uncharacterized protein n=1 Tax=Papaver nudicaule TaxID=74823 RepID=A0AA41VBA7_PAPNU|nr:hypothetical protein [Papaver nudicaule]
MVGSKLTGSTTCKSPTVLIESFQRKTTVLIALCIKHVNQLLKKMEPKSITPSLVSKSISEFLSTSQKKIQSTVRFKVIPFLHEKRRLIGRENKGSGKDVLWQKSIMMGEKCQPPDFSGVIYYDSQGHQVGEMPRSPRSAQMQNFYDFPFAVHGNKYLYSAVL